MRKIHLIAIWLIFTVVKISAQTPQIDSLTNLLSTLRNDTGKVELMHEITNTWSMQNLDSAQAFAKKSIPIAAKYGTERQLYLLQTALGRTFANLSQPDSALYYFAKAKSGFEKIGNKKGVANVLSKQRWVQNYLGNYEKAAELAFETLEVYREIGDQVGEAIAYTYVAEAFYPQQKFDELLEYALKAYEIQQVLDVPDDLAYTSQLLADGYLQTKDYDKALAFANESLSLRRSVSTDFDVALSLNTRGNIYKYTERYDEALKDYAESRVIAQKTGFTGLEMTTWSNSADVYNRMKNFRKALPMHLKMQKMVAETGELYKASENYKHIADAYAGIGKFDSAFYYQKLHTELGDSLLTEDSNERVAELQTKYETAQKEATIVLQKEQISRQWTVQRYSIGIGALLSALAGLLFYGYRNNRRKNQILEKKNEKIKLLLSEIHHRIKNNLQIISSLLNLQTANIKDKAALDAVRAGKTRVESMGLIHQKLYGTEDITSVDMSSYLQELGDTILDTFGVDEEKIKINYQVESVKLDVDTAIPLGLIINELLTNSIKYAFPENRKGEIQLKMSKDENGNLELLVADNGIGSENSVTGTAFGTQLIQLLTKQLGGKMESGPDGGYWTKILL